MTDGTNKERVASFWAALYARRWDEIGTFFGPASEYTDVATPSDDVAIGPGQIVARLRLGLEPLSRIEHSQRLMVAEGDSVVTEHTETWHWSSGEHVALPFVTVQELEGGLIMRWWDYWDLGTLMGGAPAWWIEHVMQGYR
jgi:limonene-1,2-epoxide hydrolase